MHAFCLSQYPVDNSKSIVGALESQKSPTVNLFIDYCEICIILTIHTTLQYGVSYRLLNET